MAIGDMLSAKEVSRELGISVTAVHGLAQRGTLPSNWLGGIRFWSRESVKRYLADGEAQKRSRRGNKTVSRGGELVAVEDVARDARVLREERGR